MIYGVMVFITHIDKFFHNSPGKPDAGALLIFMKKFFNLFILDLKSKRYSPKKEFRFAEPARLARSLLRLCRQKGAVKK